MDISQDYRDLFKVLNKHKVKYLIVGAYAVIYYTEPRFTKDMDIWVKADIKNANRLYNALKEFGAPLKAISPEDFTDNRLIYQIGVAPIRIDIIAGLSGISFDVAWENRVKSKYGDIVINVVGIKELIKLKKTTKRKQDLLDLDELIKSRKIFKKRRR